MPISSIPFRDSRPSLVGEAPRLAAFVAANKAILDGADLAYANLAYAHLAYADLAYANLAYANLAYAFLAGANLTGANLTGANLAGANLDGANLTDATLTDADLDGAFLSGADLTDANLTGANLARADLTPIVENLRGVLATTSRSEVLGLRAALHEGRVDGSVYEGPCACLVGTIARLRGCDYRTLPHAPASLIERWLMAIRPRLPPDHPIVAITIGWIDAWLEAAP